MNICMYKGYIRNRKQLCAELGIAPSGGRDDIERSIILHGYQRWGRGLGGRLYGSFAFVIWDDARQELFCGRDPFGIEGFYYCLTGDGRLLYASAIQPIVESPGFVKELDLEALQLYMSFGYPAGERTLYKGIRKLLPGRYLIWCSGHCSLETYFTPRFRPETDRTEEEWALQIERTLQTVIAEDRENFDDPTCRSFLSSGVDSSYMLALSGIKDACGIGFDEEQYSEAKTAAETAGLFGARFQEIRITAEDYFAKIPGFLRSMELPLADTAAVAFSIGCASVAGQTRLCMSGEGADEFFAGYHVYCRVEELGLPDGERYYGCDGVMEAEAARRLLRQSQIWPREPLVQEVYAAAESCGPLSRMLSVDISLWLEGDILFGVRQAAGTNGLTVLLPYADRRMFELAARIPDPLKRKDGCGKYILRRAAEKLLPCETAFREKSGFFVPVRDWIRDDARRGEIEAVLFGESSAVFFDQALLQRYWGSCLTGSRTDFRIVWAAYLFLVWYDTVFREGR